MKPCGRKIGQFSSHAHTKLPLLKQMQEEVRDNVKRQVIFRVMGELEPIFNPDECIVWFLTPREEFGCETPFALVCRGEEERVLAVAERIAKVASPL